MLAKLIVTREHVNERGRIGYSENIPGTAILEPSSKITFQRCHSRCNRLEMLLSEIWSNIDLLLASYQRTSVGEVVRDGTNAVHIHINTSTSGDVENPLLHAVSLLHFIF